MTATRSRIDRQARELCFAVRSFSQGFPRHKCDVYHIVRSIQARHEPVPAQCCTRSQSRWPWRSIDVRCWGLLQYGEMPFPFRKLGKWEGNRISAAKSTKGIGAQVSTTVGIRPACHRHIVSMKHEVSKDRASQSKRMKSALPAERSQV